MTTPLTPYYYAWYEHKGDPAPTHIGILVSNTETEVTIDTKFGRMTFPRYDGVWIRVDENAFNSIKGPTTSDTEPTVVEESGTKPVQHTTGSKMSIAAGIYETMIAQKKSRKEIIEAFIDQAKCTKAGASTYYQILKDRSGN